MKSLHAASARLPQPCPPARLTTRSNSARVSAANVDRVQSNETQSSAQAVPEHAILRIRQLEAEVQKAYQSGYNAGYTAGVKVTVNVDLSRGSSSSSHNERQQGSTANNGSASSSSYGVTANNSSSSSSSSQQQQVHLQQREQSQKDQDSKSTAAAAAAGDSVARSAVKGLVWRVFSTTATVGVALLLLHDVLQVQDALKFGAAEFTLKYVLYFLHERLWVVLPLL